jgi:DNA-directed RNA polymerase specialized sigma24 family protein
MEKSARRIPEENAASQEEILAALSALTDEQLLKLRNFARFRINGLGQKSGGRDYEDLLGEAVKRTLAGDRRWNKSVGFFQHLRGAMRSTSTHWKENFDKGEGRIGLPTSWPNVEGEGNGHFLHLPSGAPDCERVLSAKQTLEEVEQLFTDEPLIREIIDGLRDNLSGPDIQHILRLSQVQYETAVKRMRRKVRAAFSKKQDR